MKRIVIKIGTNTLTKKDGSIDKKYVDSISKELSGLRKKGKEIIIVTSGAIGSGCYELGIKTKVRDIKLKQACAAIGQNRVIQTYHNSFRKYKQLVAQVLISYKEFSDRRHYLNLRRSMEELLKLGVIPIINENDIISTDEIGANFGDNDKLSALVASKMDAQLLIMMSDIDALYDKDPKKSKGAKKIDVVREIDKEITRMAGKRGSGFSVGGMKTKIEAAKITMESGCDMVICNGRVKNVITKVVCGEKIGTLFLSKKNLSNKGRWILYSRPKGRIAINERAKDVLSKGRSSLLAVGIEEVSGTFDKGDVVQIGEVAKCITDYSSEDLKKIKGSRGKVAAKCENIITKR